MNWVKVTDPERAKKLAMKRAEEHAKKRNAEQAKLDELLAKRRR